MEFVFRYVQVGVGMCPSESFVPSMSLTMVRGIIIQDRAFFTDPDFTPAKIFIFFLAS